ncbi:MAG: GNAT family N-acetyltransferase [Actinomycetota bacterium]
MADDEVRLRAADVADLSAVTAVDPLAGSGEAGRGQLLDRAVREGGCLVAVDETGVAGFVVSRPGHFFGRDFVELLVVGPDRRREGIGRRLLRAAVVAAGPGRVFTSTNRTNRPMRALLDAEGWTFSGELVGLDEDDPELVFFTDPARAGH